MQLFQDFKIFGKIAKREIVRLCSRPVYIFCMIFAPIFCLIFFTTLMDSGLPQGLPVGVVDLDQTHLSRTLTRTLDVFQQTKIVAHYESQTAARIAIQKGEIYGFYYIPKDFSKKIQGFRQPQVSFYTNNAYLVAGSLMYRDMRMISEMASGAVTRELMYARGATERQAMAFLQPIVIDTHAISNPWINYSVYLCNTLIPGILMLLIFMVTVFSIGTEIQDKTSREWLAMTDNNIWLAMYGKIIPQTIIFFLVGAFIEVYFFKVLNFPCVNGLFPMLLAMFLLVIAAQAFGIFMIGCFPTLRLGLSFASLFGVISLSISGFSYPVLAMYKPIYALCNLTPLRHFYMIYADQALNGFPMYYSWTSYAALLLFLFLPFITNHRLKDAMIKCNYIP